MRYIINLLKNKQGQAMIMMVLILGATILGISTIAGYITIQKIKTATDIIDSTKAIYAADSGVEKCFYEKYKNNNATSTCNFNFQLENNSKVQVIDDGGDVIKSIGNSGRSWRAFGIFLNQFQ